jgi:hypothetical protein
LKIPRFPWKVGFALSLIGISALLHYIHFLIFKDAQHIFIYLLGDIAFVPISVLLVTLVLEHILENQQKDARLDKLNMVVDAFFSEVGYALIRNFQVFLAQNPGLQTRCDVNPGWKQEDFAGNIHEIKRSALSTDARSIDLEDLLSLLSRKKIFILSLLENPNLLEHDKFTDMLWAISHLTEELLARNKLTGLTERDLDHLSGDIKRAFTQLIFIWIGHMKHLQKDYPYLFSLAVRQNPFNPSAHAEIP